MRHAAKVLVIPELPPRGQVGRQQRAPTHAPVSAVATPPASVGQQERAQLAVVPELLPVSSQWRTLAHRTRSAMQKHTHAHTHTHTHTHTHAHIPRARLLRPTPTPKCRRLGAMPGCRSCLSCRQGRGWPSGRGWGAQRAQRPGLCRRDSRGGAVPWGRC